MNTDALYQVILSPIVSEKSVRTSDLNKQVVFKVRRDANKLAIAKAVEHIFNVKVAGVTTLNVKSKARRMGRILGRTKAWKKAYVSLAEGYDIDFSQGAVA
jgi:large subunit ribosomal protein L23